MALFEPTGSLGELDMRKCGLCHRTCFVVNEWYHCITHDTLGKIITKAEANRPCDPRYGTNKTSTESNT